jgi:hypothetical protein
MGAFGGLEAQAGDAIRFGHAGVHEPSSHDVGAQELAQRRQLFGSRGGLGQKGEPVLMRLAGEQHGLLAAGALPTLQHEHELEAAKLETAHEPGSLESARDESGGTAQLLEAQHDALTSDSLSSSDSSVAR